MAASGVLGGAASASAATTISSVAFARLQGVAAESAQGCGDSHGSSERGQIRRKAEVAGDAPGHARGVATAGVRRDGERVARTSRAGRSVNGGRSDGSAG